MRITSSNSCKTSDDLASVTNSIDHHSIFVNARFTVLKRLERDASLDGSVGI